jgi:glycosyltransferase involved in cell wall biosynthesis
VIQEGETGLLAPAGDERAIADAILVLASDSERRRQMGQRGRERAAAVFAETRMHACYQRLYEELLRD